MLFLGDSITQSWNAEGKQVFAEHFAPRGVFNAGVSGDRTQHVLWRLDHGLLQALAANGNDIRGVVLMIGTNNSNGNDNIAEEIAAGVQAIVARLRRGLPQARVLLLAIFPRGQRPDAQRAKNATASMLAAAPFLGDAMVTCRDIGALFTAPDGTIEKQVMRDYLHLTAAGYGIWAQALLADVDTMLGESR
ncbi:MAG: GDSL family lipase [Planctomycetes bacterium]|nr:GDSL family lipase [Planctomycetota bacterium]MCC7395500.1 GDSL family lipase [Planctomycetota bacterium]